MIQLFYFDYRLQYADLCGHFFILSSRMALNLSRLTIILLILKKSVNILDPVNQL